MDLVEYATTFARPLTVQFVDYKPDGSTVMAYVATDGIIDAIGPLTDFQTFYFGPEFSGLTRVEVPTFGWSLDNLRLWRNAPEPGADASSAAAITVQDQPQVTVTLRYPMPITRRVLNGA